MSKYIRTIKGVEVDVYDVLTAFGVTCPATAHALKKCLMPGARGHKDEVQDLAEAAQALSRAVDLAADRVRAANKSEEETSYLLRSKANADRLERSISQLDAE